MVTLIAAGLVLTGLSAALAWQAPSLTGQGHPDLLQREIVVAGSVAAGVVFLVSCLALRTAQPRWMLFWVLLVGLACRLLLLAAPPVMASDYYRYMWDGTVWLHGYNPWRFSPAAALAGSPTRIPAGLHELAVNHRKFVRRINHNHLPTIYPPVSEAVFVAAAWMGPFNTLALKAWLFLFDVATAAVLALLLRRLKLPGSLLLIYWWNPVVINAFANEAHLDSITLFFVALFFYYLVSSARHAEVGAGVALGLAIGAKFWPVVLGLVVLRKYWKQPRCLFTATLAAVASAAVALAPMFGTGPRAFISLSAYAHYWQANDLVFHLLFMLWRHLVTAWSAAHLGAVATILTVYGIAALVLMRQSADGARAIRTSLYLTAFIFLLSPTEFPWYYTWLVPMLVFCPRPSLLLWSCTLGLYHWAYIGAWVVWVEHLPVILLLVVESFSSRARLFLDFGASTTRLNKITGSEAAQ